MSVEDVTQALLSIKPYVDEFQKYQVGSEQPLNEHALVNRSEWATRYIAVDPVLRALGWDLSNPKQCMVEYPLRQKRAATVYADYVLFHKCGQKAVIVEAKRIYISTNQEENWEQLAKYYFRASSASVVAVTNGQFWDIAFPNGEQIEWESPYPLGVQYPKTDQNARRLWNALAAENFGW